jgi:hypothetical protein
MASQNIGSEINHEKISDGRVSDPNTMVDVERSGISSTILPIYSNCNLDNGISGYEIPMEGKTNISVEKTHAVESGEVETANHVTSEEVSYDEDGEEHYTRPAETAEDLVTEVLHVHDDPTLNPWTFRVWFIGNSISELTD